MRGVPIDRQAVHVTLWEARNRLGQVKVYQKRFAETLGISQYHMNRIMRSFEDEGRIRRVASRHLNVGVYLIEDPRKWDGTAGLEAP